MYSTPQQQAKFIEVLGHTLKDSTDSTVNHLNIIINDDQIDNISNRVHGILSDPNAAKYINGAGLHWYENLLGYTNPYQEGFYNWLDPVYQFMLDQYNHENANDKAKYQSNTPPFILATEASIGFTNQDVSMNDGIQGTVPWTSPNVNTQLWDRGEAYAHDIIYDLNHHVSGWTDWNLLLNLQGGPNWASNVVDSPIIYDPAKQVFYKCQSPP